MNDSTSPRKTQDSVHIPTWRDYGRDPRPMETTEQLRSMSYSEYLLSRYWEELRQTVLKRAGYRCQICNSGYYLQVHHRVYGARGQEHPGDLTVLCIHCHSLFHENRRINGGAR